MAPYTGQKYNGKETVIYWLAGGGTVDLTGDSRDLSINEQASEIDVTTRGNAQADARDYLADVPERTFQLQSLDTRGNSQAWDQIAIADQGTLVWYPEGTAVGKRRETATATLLQKNRTYPYNNAVTIDLQGRLNSAIAQDTVS